ncbi:MAG TPA: lactonase family protein [Bryobacteraceae bacterium]|nr:lactonase family protein [Bryobacteraceae bacterium]
MFSNWLRAASAPLLLALTVMSSSHISATPEKTHQSYILYVGNYGKGVYAYRYHPGSTKLEPLNMVGEVVNPSFLATDPDYRYLYAASEVDGHQDGAIAAFAINRTTGALTALNSRSSEGLAPCHLVVDHTGKMLMAANYTSGSVPVYPLEHDGKLGAISGLMKASGTGPNAKRQEGPHAHQTVLSADNRFVYVPDLGLDEIRIYRLDPAHAKLTPAEPPFVKSEPGSGPRHIVLSHDGKFAYVIHELKPEVGVFSRDAATGKLTRVQTVSSVPEGFTGHSDPAEILLDKSGKFVYASNRTAGTIAVFAVNASDGTLKQVQVVDAPGKSPRGIEFDPTGHLLFVGDQRGNRFVIYTIDAKTGQLTATGDGYDMPSPVAFQFVPAK